MTHSDLNNDEIRRQLRAVDRMNSAVVPRWREALSRLMGDDQVGTDEKATILGVPSPNRRDLFKLGSASILGVALLAACGSDSAGYDHARYDRRRIDCPDQHHAIGNSTCADDNGRLR